MSENLGMKRIEMKNKIIDPNVKARTILMRKIRVGIPLNLEFLYMTVSFMLSIHYDIISQY